MRAAIGGIDRRQFRQKNSLLIVERNPRLSKKARSWWTSPSCDIVFGLAWRKNRLGTTSARWGAKNLGEKNEKSPRTRIDRPFDRKLHTHATRCRHRRSVWCRYRRRGHRRRARRGSRRSNRRRFRRIDRQGRRAARPMLLSRPVWSPLHR